jgi:glycosyltransferase involved in cell wall biosynthesis
MSLKKPVVQYDLKEGRFSAQGASLYALNNDTRDFAYKIIQLIDDRELRIKMGNLGYSRVLNELSWEYEKDKLIGFYTRILFNEREESTVSNKILI